MAFHTQFPSFKAGRYVPTKVLGTGTYGQVFSCLDQATGDLVAVKVAQREDAYRRSALNEIEALRCLRYNADALKFLDSFEDSGRVCIVTELLDKDMYEILRQRSFAPLSLEDVRRVATHMLQALSALHSSGFMHCDIKPENIMIRKPVVHWAPLPTVQQQQQPRRADDAIGGAFTHAPSEKHLGSNMHMLTGTCELAAVDSHNSSSAETNLYADTDETNPAVDFNGTCLIDFGAVRRFHENSYFDVQSLWYRAPEVLCGLPYTTLIDSWSVGCTLFELYTGRALFPCDNTQEQLNRIVSTLGYPSQKALSLGRNVRDMRVPIVTHSREMLLCSFRQYVRSRRQRSLLRANQGFTQQQMRHRSQTDRSHASSSACRPADTATSSSPAQLAEEDMFIDLIVGLLNPDEEQRLSCVAALYRPFFTCVDNASRQPTPVQSPPAQHASVTSTAVPIQSFLQSSQSIINSPILPHVYVVSGHESGTSSHGSPITPFRYQSHGGVPNTTTAEGLISAAGQQPHVISNSPTNQVGFSNSFTAQQAVALTQPTPGSTKMSQQQSPRQVVIKVMTQAPPGYAAAAAQVSEATGSPLCGVASSSFPLQGAGNGLATYAHPVSHECYSTTQERPPSGSDAAHFVLQQHCVAGAMNHSLFFPVHVMQQQLRATTVEAPVAAVYMGGSGTSQHAAVSPVMYGPQPQSVPELSTHHRSAPHFGGDAGHPNPPTTTTTTAASSNNMSGVMYYFQSPQAVAIPQSLSMVVQP